MKLLLDTHIILWALYDNPLQTHNDPFDRIMIAQAKAEGLKFVTYDSKIPFYRESCIIAV